MAIISKISLIVSVVLFGYNLSLFLNRYINICEKALKYRDILSQEHIALKELRSSNFKLEFIGAIIYLSLLYFSHISLLFLAVIGLKFALSLYLSDIFQKCVVDGKSIPKKLYWSMKFDSLINLTGAIFIAVVLAV